MRVILYDKKTNRMVAELCESVVQEVAEQASVSPNKIIDHWRENYRVEIVSDEEVQDTA